MFGRANSRRFAMNLNEPQKGDKKTIFPQLDQRPKIHTVILLPDEVSHKPSLPPLNPEFVSSKSLVCRPVPSKSDTAMEKAKKNLFRAQKAREDRAEMKIVGRMVKEEREEITSEAKAHDEAVKKKMQEKKIILKEIAYAQRIERLTTEESRRRGQLESIRMMGLEGHKMTVRPAKHGCWMAEKRAPW